MLLVSVGTRMLPGVEQRSADSCSWLFIQTQRDGTGARWQMCGVIIRMTCNTAVEHRGQNYTAAGCLNGWAGQRLWRRIGPGRLKRLCQKIFQSQLRGFCRQCRETRLCGSRLVHMCWYLRTPTDCWCEIKNVMMDFVPLVNSFQCHWTQKGFQNKSILNANLESEMKVHIYSCEIKQ